MNDGGQGLKEGPPGPDPPFTDSDDSLTTMTSSYRFDLGIIAVKNQNRVEYVLRIKNLTAVLLINNNGQAKLF